MEIPDKLKDLNMTPEEVNMFSQAFKDDKFKEMLFSYAEELSNPKNREIYEEEIKLLEQERGNNIEFIHPVAFRAFKTSVDGKRKCYINICANDKIGKPEIKRVDSRGQWLLPHALHPGRQEYDSKGKLFTIYDVIFHPDTLHLATKIKKVMEMVIDSAVQGVQEGFKVSLDKKNLKEMKIKYKGTPQPCSIRKPIPGFKAKDAAKEHDPLAFPYPDNLLPNKPPTSTPSQNSGDMEPKSFQVEPRKSKEPTKPHHTLKYRSFIDLQDFRCSRDSAQSPRPKEIVVTVDMPLLKSVRDTVLEVKERRLLLESKSPSYRLELPLAYPVDENKGEAKFNKQKSQLTVTLPVKPADVSLDFYLGAPTSDAKYQSDSTTQDKEMTAEEKEQLAERVEESDVEKERGEEKADGHRGESDQTDTVEEDQEQEKDVSEALQREEILQKKKQNEDEKDVQNKCNSTEEGSDSRSSADETLFPSASFDMVGSAASPDKAQDALSETETQDILISNKVEEETQSSSVESHLKEKAEQRNNAQPNMEENDPEPQNHTSAAVCVTQTTPTATESEETSDRDVYIPPAQSVISSVETTTAAEEEDEDDLPAEQRFQTSKRKNRHSVVALKEIHPDGSETVITDHSTSSGIIFQNKLLYELD